MAKRFLVAGTFNISQAGAVRHSLASIEAAQSLIGYQPAVTFPEGRESTIASRQTPSVDFRARRS